jgi:hypothetical protein
VLDAAVEPTTKGVSGDSATVLPAARAQIERMAGNPEAARAHLNVAAPGMTDAGSGIAAAHRLAHHAVLAAQIDLVADDLLAARTWLCRAAAAAVDASDGPVSAVVAETTAQLAHAEGDDASAAELLGVAAAQRGTLDLGSPDVTTVLAAVRAALGSRADDLIGEW